MNGKKEAAVLLFLITCAAAYVFVWAVLTQIEETWSDYLLWGLGIVMAVYVLFELRTIALFARAARFENADRKQAKGATELVLLNENFDGIKSWDLRNETGLIIGRGQDDSDVDIDLSETEYFSLISPQHAVLNFTNKGWMLSDAGSRNGTSLRRAGAQQKLLLAPGEPIPIRPGDTIHIAEETLLAVK